MAIVEKFMCCSGSGSDAMLLTSRIAWHITHRRHKKEFSSQICQRTRRSWMDWLFEAKKRYRLRILNFTVTSNCILLLVYGSGKPDAILRSMQSVAGRIAQEFNHRKDRKGTFREDRYHATAVEINHHLISCLTYIDFNMVGAGRLWGQVLHC